MVQKPISSVELAALVEELRPLVGGKISHIYQQEKEFIFQIHKGGKKLLRLMPGKGMHLAAEKGAAPAPTGFCMQLRKHISNATIRSLVQKDAQRIVILELEKKDRFLLIAEFFSKGNLILTDGTSTIIACLERQEWKERTIEPGKKYQFPQQESNWKEISKKDFSELLAGSGKRNLATALATELGLGGIYAEELCFQGGVKKETLPSALSQEDASELYLALGELRQRVQHPRGHVYAELVAPIELHGRKVLKEFETFSEALASLRPQGKPSPYEKKISALRLMLAQQQEAVRKLEEKSRSCTRHGEMLYEHYAEVQEILAEAAEASVSRGWGAALEKVKKNGLVRGINPKTKSVLLQFDDAAA